MIMVKHANVEMYRRGQDPFFLRTIRHRAGAWGLKGFAETRPDGALYLELEGEEEQIKKFIEEYEHGEESKEVIRIEPAFTEEYKGYETFEIRD